MNEPRRPDDKPRPTPARRADFRVPIDRLVARFPIFEDPVIDVAPAVLARYNARILDPSAAAKAAGQTDIRFRPTVYIGDNLIVSTTAESEVFTDLETAANSKGLTTQSETRENTGSPFHTVVPLEPAPGSAAEVDAWEVLQAYRAVNGTFSTKGQQVSLNHLLLATRYTHGSPFDREARSATSSYAEPGSGGRMPVAWIGAPPNRRSDDEVGCRRPVVAILDTGISEHPWLTPDVVSRVPLPNGLTPLFTPLVENPFEGTLAPLAGHGTFIAGLIRQACPDANLIDLRVMGNDGAVPEDVLLSALALLVERQTAAQQPDGDGTGFIDVVSLSLGYYHETPDDPTFDWVLMQPLRALAEMGVAVVASAGNDATSRPMFPAAFLPHGTGEIGTPDSAHVPLMSVGALNPDGTIAMFSNAGDWVGCHRPGAELVSTFPVTLDASAQAGFRVGYGDRTRSTIDPDDFASGFGTWSGTSFAAPVLAGELAASLIDGSCGDTDAIDKDASVARGWAALTARTGLACP